MRKILSGVAGVIIVGAGLAMIFNGNRSADEGAVLAQPDREVVRETAEPALPPSETFAQIFEPCAHCHQVGDGARATSGPALTGVVGRPVASTDYPYSQAMRDSGLTWDEATLRAFLAHPLEVVPGSRMKFDGLPEDEIGPMIEFLKNPMPNG